MMSFDDAYVIMRRLANTAYYQTLFIREDLRVFENDTNLSDIQVIFLSLLGFYHTLNIDNNSGEVDDIVFKDIVYEDAYMHWKTYKNKKDRRKHEQQDASNQHRPMGLQKDKVTSKNSQWIFK